MLALPRPVLPRIALGTPRLTPCPRTRAKYRAQTARVERASRATPARAALAWRSRRAALPHFRDLRQALSPGCRSAACAAPMTDARWRAPPRGSAGLPLPMSWLSPVPLSSRLSLDRHLRLDEAVGCIYLQLALRAIYLDAQQVGSRRHASEREGDRVCAIRVSSLRGVSDDLPCRVFPGLVCCFGNNAIRSRRWCSGLPCRRAELVQQQDRSEEHTSELQSHSDLVCRLLLERKARPERLT